MTRSLSTEEALAIRLRSQRLGPDAAAGSVHEAVSAAAGIQAQEKPSAFLSVRSRTSGATLADVEAALYEERSVVRTWCMRGTLHLVASENLSRLLSILGPAFASRGPETKQLAEMGFDEGGVDRAVGIIERILGADGPLTRDELADRLVAEGVGIEPGSRGPNVLIRQAALRGAICEVAPRDGDNAYDRLREWVSPDEPRDRERELADLARRYLSAYAPASLEDFAAWSGLYMRDVREAWQAIAAERTEVDVDGRPASILTEVIPERAPSPDEPTVSLLPGYDTYLLGYTPENRPVPEPYRSRVWPGAGIVRPTVVLGGRVVATWKLDRSADPPVVLVDAFESLGANQKEGIEAEVRDVGRFLAEPELAFVEE